MLKITNPATGEVIKELTEDTASSLQAKFTAAGKAQKNWARVPLPQRIDTLRKFAQLVADDRESLARTLTSEMGKPVTQARNELSALGGRIDYFLENVTQALADEVVFPNSSGTTSAPQDLEEIISHEPLGVIGNISAWNYPYFVGSNVFIPALLGGNAVLYKPSEFSTLTGLAITRLLHKAGVPTEAFAAVIGGGAVGAELMKQPLNGVFFTGSYATGLKIAEQAARRLMKVQLELGGKDPTYVCEDTNIQVAAESLADGAFYNTGQSCCSVERIYVHKSVHDRFVEAFLTTVKNFKMGDPLEEGTYIGPLSREAHLGYLDRQIEDARSKGARVLTGGQRVQGPGNFFQPTVLTGVNHTMELMREETFGPLIGIQAVDSDEVAIQLMNDTPYGLTAGVYTQDAPRAKAILAQINSGSVYWNCCDRVSPRLPWSGRGHSGIGCTLSTYGIQTFAQPKAWHLKTMR